jgi:hypothetical protein
MAKPELRSKAIEMRFQGMSYTLIREALGVSKGTLSSWLRQYPLSEERIRMLRDFNQQRIERCRETKARKRSVRLEGVYQTALANIGSLSEREIFLCGLFLYWGEGGKTQNCRTSISNTDPAVLNFFLTWLVAQGIEREHLKVHVHLYHDMDIESELAYWSNTLALPRKNFRKPYIKRSTRSSLTYRQRFTHGTCNLIYENRDMSEYIVSALDVIRSSFADTSTV